MRGFALALLAPLALVPRSAGADVEVHVEPDGSVSVRADAPAAEVLDRLAERTGMKVVYDGTAPRARVFVAFEHRTPAEAVLMILEGLGVDHLMRMDATGKRPQMLLLSASNTSTRPLPGSTPATPAMRPAPREAVEEEDVEAEEEEQPVDEGVEGATRRPPMPQAHRPTAPGAQPSPAPVNRPAFVPPNYPVSPFAPPAPSPPTVIAPPSPTPAPEATGEPDQ